MFLPTPSPRFMLVSREGPAFKWLERANEERDVWLMNSRLTPCSQGSAQINASRSSHPHGPATVRMKRREQSTEQGARTYSGFSQSSHMQGDKVLTELHQSP